MAATSHGPFARAVAWLCLGLSLALHGLARRWRPASARRFARTAAPAPTALRALTAAALALPGLAQRAGAADDDGFEFLYGRYEETSRDLAGIDSLYAPIEVDSVLARGRVTLVDRLKLAMSFLQDTWSGATPIATAPFVLGGNRPTAPDGVSGATPFLQGELFLDSERRPLAVDPFGQVLGTDTRLVHTLSSASPEVRREADLDLAWELDDATLGIGGGASFESDYDAWFLRMRGGLDLGEKSTRVSGALSYTHGDTSARLDHDAVPYIDLSGSAGHVSIDPDTGDRTYHGDRHDVGAELGVTQILGPNTFVELSAGYVHASGYLANPYKVVEVAFIDPEQQFLAPPGGYYAQVRALIEQRPDHRNQWTAGTRVVQYVPPADASLHVGYRFYHDDWHVDAHTFEASWGQPLGFGVTLTPRIRYYTQDEASFYTPYLVSDQAYESVEVDPDTGEILSITPFDPRRLPSYYSSDHRLSGFGSLSSGATLAKAFARGFRLTGDFEYYTHQGSLALGGGGEDGYADYDAYQFNLSVALDASALHAFGYAGESAHAGHGSPVDHYLPAGVMGGHMLPAAGDLMVAVHSMWSRQSGDLRHGSGGASDDEVLARGCEGAACTSAPDRMDMSMLMLELMGAPAPWLNVMFMAPFVAMDMELRPLEGAAPDIHASHDHTTGGVGDLSATALVRLFESEGQHLHAGLGLGVPTGDVDLRFRRTHQESRGYVHYGMQLGSGTWDFLPSLTYTGSWQRWSWGGQVSGAVRLEDANRSGYALGDLVQATAWGSRSLTSWLSVSLRALFAAQAGIDGSYEGLHSTAGPMDFPGSYGGRYWDLGLGLGLVVPHGYLAGNRLRVEWLQPLAEHVRGYQLERTGSLFAVWSVEF